jgi:hypothetical protein
MKHSLKAILYSFVIIALCNITTAYASSASLFITKTVSAIAEGEKITIDVKVQSSGQAINAVSGTILFPENLLRIVSISRDNSILNIWTHDPNIVRNQISFEGVILNPGYKGSGGSIFHITFEAKKRGFATISFSDGAVLANDGLGTNVIGNMNPISFNIIDSGSLDLIKVPIASEDTQEQITKRLLALPVITDYSIAVNSKDTAYLKGKGEPNALTKLSFEDVSHKSFGEQFMDFIQSKKKRLSDVLVKNNDKGLFEYVTPNNLIAGVYNATPYLVDNDTNTNKPGLGVQLFVNDSKIVKWLIIFINILILLIPIVGLIMIVYFIPWYSARRMRILKRKMGLEEEKIEITQHELERQDEALSHTTLPAINTEKKE